ncbi:MAG: glycosyltransferase [Elusimicrobia bacterium]|jgi:dolichol-phosphate mannosyltransferase|nr:glycosyltransferase [Elusimicrobiota bacterium]
MKKYERKYYIILPCYNEYRALSELIPAIEKVIKNKYEIVIVDDASSDSTKSLVSLFRQKRNIKYIRHKKNRGPGKAIQTGLKYVIKISKPEDYIVVMDADYTHPPALINSMAALSDERNDIVIGSRFCPGGRQIGVGLLRKLLSFAARVLMTVIFNIRGITDYTSGYRIYRAGLIKDYFKERGEMPVKTSGFEATLELLMKLIFFGASVREAPLILRYDRKYGPTKMNLSAALLGYLFMVLKLKILKPVLTRKNKILHIVNIPWYSGLAAYGEDMAFYSEKYSDKFSYDIEFATVKDSALTEKIKKNFKTIELYGRNSPDTLKSIFKVSRSLNNTKIIFAHTGSSFFLAIAASLFKKVKVYRVRAERGKIKKNIFNIILHKLAAGVIAPTMQIAEDFKEFGIKEKKIFFLPPVVDLNNFSAQPLNKSNLIGIVGRLDKVKGHKILIKSLALIKEQIPDIELIIIGKEEGVAEDELIKEAKSLGVADKIKFMGKVKYETIPILMAECRIGVIPSLGSEAVSRVAVEWMAVGRPVVASNVGCLEEFIGNKYNGFLVSPGDPGELAERIIDILKTGWINEKMAEQAAKYCQEHFTPELYNMYLKKILDE